MCNVVDWSHIGRSKSERGTHHSLFLDNESKSQNVESKEYVAQQKPQMRRRRRIFATSRLCLTSLILSTRRLSFAFLLPSAVHKNSFPSPKILSFDPPAKDRKVSRSALFGISGFRQWLEEQFPTAVKHVDVSKYSETIDHVLVDMNQILHPVLRRSSNDSHAMKMLIMELDTLIQRIRPSKSLVLAIDGSPAAAKLATQRKRRANIRKNTQFKLQHIDKMRVSQKLRAKRMRKYQSELQSLQLTPGTKYMQLVESTILYWAWQRLQTQGKPNSKLLPDVRIHFSSSLVPGEGETKMLEWIHNFRGSLSKCPGQSVALVGGDADLLLEALVLPPAWTHNVFVIRQEEIGDKIAKKINGKVGKANNTKKEVPSPRFRNNYLFCTSLWEMTLSLDEYCRSTLPPGCYNSERDYNLLLQIRNDLVLLLVLNGNDYIPGLIATGFRDVFQCYMTLLVQYIMRHGTVEGAGLVDPNALTFRLPFCIEFFGILGQRAPSEANCIRSLTNSSQRTYQSLLNDMVSIGYVPAPIKYDFVSGRRLKEIHDLPALDEGADYKEDADEEGFEGLVEDVEDVDDNFDDEDDFDTYDDVDDEYVNEDDDEQEHDDVQEEDDEHECDDAKENDYVQEGALPLDFREETESLDDSVLDHSRKILVRLTIGNNGQDGFGIYQTWSNQSSKAVSKAKGKLAKQVLKDYSLLDLLVEERGLEDIGYDWEIKKAAPSRVDRYLAGLLWTLQTYQDGICPSYGYNYGKCVAPTGRMIEEFLNRAMQENRKVGAQELLRDYKFGGAISAGVASLAALPTSEKHLVPEPYSLIDDETVERLFGECMDPHDNFFYLQKFQSSVDEEVRKITKEKKRHNVPKLNLSTECNPSGKRIILGDHYWTVLSRVNSPLPYPFQPPSPPTELFSALPPNPFIKASRIISLDWPRPRPGWNVSLLNDSKEGHYQSSWLSKHNSAVDHLDFGSLMHHTTTSLRDVPYKVAFKSSKPIQNPQKGRFKVLRSSLLDPSAFVSTVNETDLVSNRTNSGHNSVTVLKQLRDVGIVKDFVFHENLPAPPGSDTVLTTILVFGGPMQPTCISFSRRRAWGERKKYTREHLASIALDAMIRHRIEKRGTSSGNDVIRWHHVPFTELKHLLTNEESPAQDNKTNSSTITTNSENVTALMLLKQLADLRIIHSFDFVEDDNSIPGSYGTTLRLFLMSTLRGEIGEIEPLKFSLTRVCGVDSKKATKQKLASQALDHILNIAGESGADSAKGSKVKQHNRKYVRWNQMTFDDIKNHLLFRQSCN